jgi:hypothetical protein
MTDHIYGRKDIVTNSSRPNMFIAELYLYIDYLKEQIAADFHTAQFAKRKKYFTSFYQNLKDGIQYYQQLRGIAKSSRKSFLESLDSAALELDSLNYQYEVVDCQSV